MYRVVGTATYEKEVSKLDKSEKDEAEKIPKRLAENPYVGDQLRYPFLREKRLREKRAYYLIYDDLKLVLLVATSGKKDQQETINYIKNRLPQFRKIAEEFSRQVF